MSNSTKQFNAQSIRRTKGCLIVRDSVRNREEKGEGGGILEILEKCENY
jgi:hypothetical protein